MKRIQWHSLHIRNHQELSRQVNLQGNVPGREMRGNNEDSLLHIGWFWWRNFTHPLRDTQELQAFSPESSRVSPWFNFQYQLQFWDSIDCHPRWTLRHLQLSKRDTTRSLVSYVEVLRRKNTVELVLWDCTETPWHCRVGRCGYRFIWRQRPFWPRTSSVT